MTIEWIIAGALLILALGPLVRRLPMTASVGLGVIVVAAGIGVARQAADTATRLAARATVRHRMPRDDRRGEFTGAEACRACHPDQFATWHRSYHRTMTQPATPATVGGVFDGRTLEHDGARFRLERRGDAFWVNGSHPITMVTGSHHMQAYWLPHPEGNGQTSLPFTYLYEDQRWVPRRDVFLFAPEWAYPPAIWNTNCVLCHATHSQPRQYPERAVFDSRASDLGIACEACHGPGGAHVAANASPWRRYRQHLRTSSDGTIFNPGTADHVRASEACGQCHAIRRFADRGAWLSHGIGYRAGGDLEAAYPSVPYDPAFEQSGDQIKRALMEGSFWSDGQVRVSGREFTAMRGSSCFTHGELSCLSCHALHGYQSTDDQLAPGKDGDDACVACHTAFAAASAVAAHTHHAATSPGSRCYECHMPHTSYGLLKAIRSHTITSPTAAESLATGRPNACTLCHLDRPLGWVAGRLAEWYGHPMPPIPTPHDTVAAGVYWTLAGDAGQRALVAWHMGRASTRAAAGEAWLAPYLAELLADPYSAVRYVAARSLREVLGTTAPAYDFIAPAPARATVAAAVRQAWHAGGAALPPALLLDAGGIRRDEATRLGLRRNDRPMELLE